MQTKSPVICVKLRWVWHHLILWRFSSCSVLSTAYEWQIPPGTKFQLSHPRWWDAVSRQKRAQKQCLSLPSDDHAHLLGVSPLVCFKFQGLIRSDCFPDVTGCSPTPGCVAQLEKALGRIWRSPIGGQDHSWVWAADSWQQVIGLWKAQQEKLPWPWRHHWLYDKRPRELQCKAKHTNGLLRMDSPWLGGGKADFFALWVF